MDNQKLSRDAGRPNNFPRCSVGFPLHIPGAADKKRARAVHYTAGHNSLIEGCVNQRRELRNRARVLFRILDLYMKGGERKVIDRIRHGQRFLFFSQ